MSCLLFLSNSTNFSTYKNFKREDIDSIKINNLVLFSKVFGDIRFFYPNSAIENNYWDDFLCKTIEELSNQSYAINLQQLNNIFNKTSPECQFYNLCPQEKNILSNSCSEVEHWYYKGINPDEDGESIYKSKIITKKTKEVSRKSLFFVSKIASDIYLKLPLYVCKGGNKKLAIEKKNAYEGQVYSLANAIYIWNLIKHFYPYRNKIPVDFENSLKDVISTILSEKNTESAKRAIDKMVASIDDGHANYVVQGNTGEKYYLPEDIYVINESYYYFKKDTLLPSKKIIGGKILKINGMLIDSLFSKEKMIISGSIQFKREMFAKNLLEGDRFKTCEFQVYQGDTLITNISTRYSLSGEQYVADRIIKQKENFEYAKNIMYINMQTITYKEFLANIKKVNTSSGLIFDLRGYPNPDGETEKILCHMLKQDDTVKWIKTPIIESPDFSNVKFVNEGWRLKKNNLKIKPSIVFLINSKTYSYAESIVSYIKDYKLGVLIGEQTAGANGDIIFFPLLNNSIFMFTGSKVNGPKGTSYFAEGILPDIKKIPTPVSLANGKDDLIDNATEYLLNSAHH